MELFKILIVILLKSSTFSLAVSDFHTETIDATLDQIYQQQGHLKYFLMQYKAPSNFANPVCLYVTQ